VQIPHLLLQSLQTIKGFDENAFLETHEQGAQITSIRINPFKKQDLFEQKLHQTPVPWCSTGFYLDARPSFTFDPLFHAGCYYVQEASSMFLEQAILQTKNVSQPLKALDLCAAPGGKSTHLLSLLSEDSLVVCNEVIRSRAQILKSNIIKWGRSNAFVTNNDPKDFSQLKGFFDIIVVDAPCSGSGLFRRDAEAINEWSENNVKLCSMRQQRILADVLPALKENGILVYSTCSFSKDEDEDVVDWLSCELNLENVKIAVDADWNITEVETQSHNYCYRFWPYLVKGEGFFTAVFKKKNIEATIKLIPSNIRKLKDRSILTGWISNTKENVFAMFEENIYAWPEKLVRDFEFLAGSLRAIYSGTLMGQVIRDKFIPDHALSMSTIAAEDIPHYNLDLKNAVAYLQRREVQVDGLQKGWHLVKYENRPLGWINNLGNRINNYYPKELRILKESE
jgi:16S rRNA C967 or C1407 C5-methylase (RsmB/RsmF family)/NOL1/NOP2/fmu family ribosome biogenesis protein